MNLPDPGIRKPSEIIAGAALGVLMAVILITVNAKTGYSHNSLMNIMQCVIACALPWCASVFESRGLSEKWIESLMIIISMIICLLYGSSVAMDANTESWLIRQALLVHLTSMIFTALRLFLKGRLR